LTAESFFFFNPPNTIPPLPIGGRQVSCRGQNSFASLNSDAFTHYLITSHFVKQFLPAHKKLKRGRGALG
jgi:hypothetical protein